MKTKSNRFSSWKQKSKLSLRDRKRRKQYKLHNPSYLKPIDYLNQHLDLQNFKKFKCNKNKCKNPMQCFDYHNDQDRIRDSKYYSPEKCPENCQNEACGFAHNDFEKWYHPRLYKRVFCKSLFNVGNSGNSSNSGGCIVYNNLGKCPLRDFCPFAHNEEEIRTELFYNYDVDDDFMMFRFKTEVCPLSCIDHDKEKCLYSHSKRDHRRMVIKFAYYPKLCENGEFGEEEVDELLAIMPKLADLEVFEDDLIEVFQQNFNFLEKMKNELKKSKNKPENSKKKICSKGLDCSNCHNALEFLFHPSIYKSLQCDQLTPKNQKNPKNILKMIDDDLNLFNPSSNKKNPKPQHSAKQPCKRKHCPYSHESDKFESIQDSTEPPFYKFAYNRIIPGTFFQGRSFFSSRSENLIYQEDRLLHTPQQNFNFPQPQNMMYSHPFQAQMDPQKLYFKNFQNSWGGYNGGRHLDKENVNYLNFGSPVNMNMYRIQMNNTFLMSNHAGYGRQFNQQQGFKKAGPGGFYRC